MDVYRAALLFVRYLVRWRALSLQDSMQKSQETEIGKETRSCILAMLTDLRRACDHPFLAKSFWNAQAQAADERESRGLPANRTLAYDTPMSAKIEEVVRLVRQHPGDHSSWIMCTFLRESVLPHFESNQLCTMGLLACKPSLTDVQSSSHMSSGACALYIR